MTRATGTTHGERQREREKVVAFFLLLAVLYGLQCWPALSQTWWFLDDSARMEGAEDPFVRACQNGRPLEGLWLWTQCARGAVDPAWEQSMRWLQAAAHVAAAGICGLWLERFTGVRGARWSALPFLLWPLHVEAVLWRTAGSYPFGAALAAAALLLTAGRRSVRQTPRLGIATALVVAGALTNQVASFLPLTLLACAFAATGQMPQRRALVWLTAGQALGLFVSLVVTKIDAVATPRAALTFAPLDKLTMVSEALRHALVWRHHGLPLSVANVLPWLLVLLAVRPGHRTWFRLLAGTAATAAFACGAMLPVAESSLAWRMMYVCPWLAAIAPLALVNANLRRLGLASLAFMAGAAIPAGRHNATEYVELWRGEAEVVAAVDTLGREHAVTRCLVQPFVPAAHDANPFHLARMHEHSKLCALQVPWGLPRVSLFAKLRAQWDPAGDEPLELCDPILVHGFLIGFDARRAAVVLRQPRRR